MMAMTPRTIIFFVLVLLLVGCTVFLMQGMLPGVGLRPNDLGAEKSNVKSKVDHNLQTHSNKMSDNTDLRQPLPEDLDATAKRVQVVDNHLRVMNRDIFYREALPPEGVTASHQNAVLLHGMSFKSLTWLELNTIQLLAAMGHRVVAFDLPGYGETGGEQLDNGVKGEFLNTAIDALHLSNPVVVSPSMSGSYSLPYLFDFAGKMGGYVPVAPVYTEKYTKEQYQAVKTPTLVIYGEDDKQIGAVSTANLKNIPNSKIEMLENAKHAAYLDQPHLFHRLLYNFFLNLKH